MSMSKRMRDTIRAISANQADLTRDDKLLDLFIRKVTEGKRQPLEEEKEESSNDLFSAPATYIPNIPQRLPAARAIRPRNMENIMNKKTEDLTSDYFKKYVAPEEFGESYYKNPKYFKNGNYVAYKDSRGFLTLGPGVLVDSRIEKKFGKLKEGDEIPREAVNSIALERWHQALESADKFIPEDKKNPKAIGAVAEMVYQIGAPKLSGWKNTMNALQKGDFKQAALEARDSNWFKEQTPKRAAAVTARLEKAGEA